MLGCCYATDNTHLGRNGLAWPICCNVAFQNVTAVPLHERMNNSNEVIQAISLTNKLFGILMDTHMLLFG